MVKLFQGKYAFFFIVITAITAEVCKKLYFMQSKQDKNT